MLNLYGESWAYKNKDTVTNKIFLNFHELYLINLAIKKMNINIPVIEKTYNESIEIVNNIEYWQKQNEKIQLLEKEIENAKENFRKFRERTGLHSGKGILSNS